MSSPKATAEEDGRLVTGESHLVRLAVVIIVTAMGVLTTRPAAAGPNDEATPRRADRHYDEAVGLFGQGRYREAIEEFDRAIDLDDQPIFFCNRAVALIKLSEWNAALADLRTCRTTFDGPTSELAQIDAQYRALETLVHSIRPRAIEVAADIATGQLAPRVIEVPEHESPWNLELVGHLATGTGAALLTAAITLDYLSSDLRDDFVAQSQGGPGTSAERYRQLRQELDTRKTVFTGLTISGAALATTGVSILAYSWFFADSPAEPGRTAQSVSLAPTHGGAAVQLEFDF